MAFKLSDGTGLPTDVPFTIGDINYPANWLRLSTQEERTALGISEVADSTVYDSTFYNSDGSAKSLVDVNATNAETGELLKDENGDQVVNLGVKSILKAREKIMANSLLSQSDWYVVRKAEKSTAIPTTIQTFRDGVRTACTTRENEIDACSDTAALVNLYESTYDSDGNFVKRNMTQYPGYPYS